VPEWQREADRFGLNTIFVSLARYDGAIQFLGPLCGSQSWRLAYLDEISAVFVRRTQANAALVGQLRAECSTAKLPVQPLSSAPSAQFQQWANAALVLHVLGRQSEALEVSSHALKIFADSANLHFIRAKILAAMGQPRPALAEYFAALKLEPNDITWAAVADLYWAAGDRTQATEAMRRAIALSSRPHLMLTNLGFSYLRNAQPTEALETFDEAEWRAPIEGRDNLPFCLDLARGRASAWSALGNNQRAITYEEHATQLAPSRGDLWLELAGLYELSGKPGEAGRARLRAQELERSEGNGR
jgi:tetratricopeptide (TPR) repeat protein